MPEPDPSSPRRPRGPSGRALLAYVTLAALIPQAPSHAAEAPSPEATKRFVGLYCVACHDPDEKAGGLDLETLSSEPIERHTAPWEKVVRRLAARQMPPEGAIRPRSRDYDAILDTLTTTLDQQAAAHPAPGRTDALRRLNRAEYQNSIRDLLAIEVDAAALLPADESSQGFDNITVGDLSPTLLERYITAAQKISRLAVGSPSRAPGGDTFRVRPDLTQEGHIEGLPIGTRGGGLFPYTFPQDGEYEISLRLARDRNEHIEGLREPSDVEILINRDRVARFTIQPPKSEHDHQTADEPLRARVKVSAGPHPIGVAFPKGPSSLLETKRQPSQARYNMHRHPRTTPALFQVSITGPFQPDGHGETPSRLKIFAREPKDAEDELACARDILAPLARRAFRRPVTDSDLEAPLTFFHQSRADGGDFDAGIEAALASILVSPKFLFRVEPDPPGLPPKTPYRLDDVQLASRLSFFLWSSLPDDELLDLAEKHELSRPEVFERQARRMLADPRSRSLVTNFAGQWLHLRNLDSTTPDLRLFPDFDDNLRQAFRTETELAFQELLREDRSVLQLLKSDHAYLNERLAKHYGVPHVYGTHFRRVPVGPDNPRGGLLRQGSILTVTSYATRTSPTIRGKWILENLLGTPPPPPPPDIPALKDAASTGGLSVRDRLAEHRKNIACAGCHKLMDPVGFSLENFDAVGRWRDSEGGHPADSAGGLPDGSRFQGVDGLEAALLKRPEVFVDTLVGKLLTFALGRLVGPDDAPAIRKVVNEARAHDFKFSSLIVGIVSSTPFQSRTTE